MGDWKSGTDGVGDGEFVSDTDDYYRICAIPKPEPRCVTKKRRDKVDAKDERAKVQWIRRAIQRYFDEAVKAAARRW